MNLKKYLLVIAVILNFMLLSSANAMQTTYGKITLIKAFDSQAYVYVSGLNDPFGCGNSSFVRFYWGDGYKKQLWSIVLAAQLSGKEVSFEGSCVSGYLSVTSVYMRN
ncbi:MAG: hypothetical protein COB33_012420 [Thiotrichaceae bacterium]|nr:hypothetical protein [Thiotrichaceae bacterium]